MRKEKSLRLVIDASVVKAAGEKSPDPTSVGSRAILETILEVCHQVVLWHEIGEEWNRNSSKFSARWKARMIGKKKCAILADCPTEEILDLLGGCFFASKGWLTRNVASSR